MTGQGAHEYTDEQLEPKPCLEDFSALRKVDTPRIHTLRGRAALSSSSTYYGVSLHKHVPISP